MQLQAIQSREFETTKEILFASVVSVFQDLGYTLNSADLPTGFITAESSTVNKTNFGEAFIGVRSSGNTRATAYIETMPNKRARVRLNFVNSKNMSSGRGQNAREDRPILDPQPYVVAWDKVDEALFVRGALTASVEEPKAVVTETVPEKSGNIGPADQPTTAVPVPPLAQTQ